MPKKRTKIPSDVETRLMANNRHTCCLCHGHKDVVIHHIDEDSSNNNPENLCVLCTGCHSDVHSNHGFGRKFTPDEVRIYKNGWEKMCKLEDNKKFVVNNIFIFHKENPGLIDWDLLRKTITQVSSGVSKAEVIDNVTVTADILAESTGDRSLANKFESFVTTPSELELQSSLNALYDAKYGGGMNQLKVLKTADRKSFDIFLLKEKTQQRISAELADDFINRWPVTNAEKEIIKVFEKLRKLRKD